MRDKLNNDPRTQVIVLAVVAVIFAFVMFTMVLGGEEEAPPPTDPAATGAPLPIGETATPSTSTPATPATPAPATGAVPAVPDTAVPATPEVAPDPGAADGLLPGKGLPKDVLVAYARGDALALVVVDPKGIADKKVEAYTRELEEQPNVEVFVVEVKDISEYARITQGVSVSRAPALVVVTPREKAGDVPTASVSYGFRSPKSVRIALQDALYDGKPVTSFPE
jgi:hypothetical protein